MAVSIEPGGQKVVKFRFGRESNVQIKEVYCDA